MSGELGSTGGRTEHWELAAWPEPSSQGARKRLLLPTWWPGRPACPDPAGFAGVASAILADLHLSAGTSGWRVQRVGTTSTSSTIVTVGPGDRPRAVIKLPHTPAAVHAMERERAVLDRLHGDLDGPPLRSLVPTLLVSGETSGQPYAVYHHLPGIPASMAGGSPQWDHRVLARAASTLAVLHRLGRQTCDVTEATFDLWVERPAELVRRVLYRRPPGCRYTRALARLVDDLRAELVGTKLSLGWVHGDLWLGNVLVDPGDASITGIVDWDKAEPAGLAVLDVLHLLLFTRSLAGGQDLGGVVRATMLGAPWSGDEERLLALGAPLVGDSRLSDRCVLALYWLLQASREIARRDDGDRRADQRLGSFLWERRNLDPVLSLW